MKPLTARARTNLELIIAEVADLCKEVKIPKNGSRRGRPPTYNNHFILQLVVLQNLLGFTSQRSFLRFLRNLEHPLFESLPDQSRYNRRTKKLKPFINKLNQQLLTYLKVENSKIRITDATGVPVIKLVRYKRRRIFPDSNRVGIGYCASQKTYYFGCKLTLLVNREGIPYNYHLTSAKHSDLVALEKTTIQKDLRNLTLVADKGYISRHIKDWLRKTRLVTLVTPYRRTQKKKNTKKEKELLKKRQIIETVIGQLKEHMGLEKLRAKTYQGLESRIDNLIFTYIFGVYFNKKHHRNPLNLKSILT